MDSNADRIGSMLKQNLNLIGNMLQIFLIMAQGYPSASIYTFILKKGSAKLRNPQNIWKQTPAQVNESLNHCTIVICIRLLI